MRRMQALVLVVACGTRVEALVGSLHPYSHKAMEYSKERRGVVMEFKPSAMKFPILDDEEAEEALSKFPIPPEELVEKAKSFILSDGGVQKPELLAETFEFIGPVVGPLSKEQYVETVSGFDVRQAFPDINPRFSMFSCDPLEPGRVWFFSRVQGTFTGPFADGAIKPTGKAFDMPPEVCSVVFDENGLVVRYTIGAVVDRLKGNSGGLGGIFGILYAVGRPLPFREAKPWRKSLRFRLFDLAGTLLRKAKQNKQ